MRVRHSPCSWLNEIVPLASVAGNTLIGMFTRLIFRKPFHVARAAINQSIDCGLPILDSRLSTLRLVPLVAVAEIQARSREVNIVRGNLIAQQAPRGAVILDGHDET